MQTLPNPLSINTTVPFSVKCIAMLLHKTIFYSTLNNKLEQTKNSNKKSTYNGWKSKGEKYVKTTIKG